VGAIEPVAAPAGLAVYSAAVGLTTAVPLPLVDRFLTGLVRGAAMRRVCLRHGVRLGREARDILGRPDRRRGQSDGALLVVRSILERAVAPLRVFARADDAVATLLSALLLDHYLHTAPRAMGAPLMGAEARRLRRAMDSAAAQALASSLWSAPAGVLRTVLEALRAALTIDTEDRDPLERLVDTALDAAADAPLSLAERMREAFDVALRSVEEEDGVP
jgi:hypothetical protein